PLLILFLVIALQALFSPAALAASPLDVVITEIAWAGHSGYTSDEWIELYNPTDSAIDLTGWALYEGGGATLIINLSGTIPSKGYFLIERGDDDTVSDIPGDVVGTFGGSGLSNTAENIVLKDNLGNTIDQVDCSGGWFAGSASPNYYTMERKDPCTAGSVSTNWASNDGVTRNGLDAGNNPINGTPRAQNSCFDSSCPGDDSTPPVVTSTDPDSGASGILTTADIIITFNEPMDQGSTVAFSIAPDPGSHVFSWNAGDTELTVMLNDFTADTLYTVTISTSARDVNGNPLDGDGDGNPGPDYIFTFRTADVVPPDAINDLVASDGPGAKQVTLEWTAVGDDGGVGTAESYIVKYSTADITDDTAFNNAITYTQTWTPQAAGNNESYLLTMPEAGTLYYFSIKAVDDSSNVSAFGNVDSATSGDSSTSVSPNIRAAAQGRVTYTFTYNVISPKFDGDDSFRLIVPAAWGGVSAGNVAMTLDGSSYTGFSVSGKEITASNITANSSIVVILGPINVQNTAQSNVEFEMFTNINGSGFAKVDGSPAITVAEPAVINVDPATDPNHAPGTTDIVTVEILDSGSNLLYGARIDLLITKNPGGDAALNTNTVYTDISGSATFQFKLSSSPGENEVMITCNSLVIYYVDTAFAGNYISQNYPNPFNLNRNRVTKFNVNLETAQSVLLNVYNVNGELVKTLYEGVLEQGLHEISWDGTNDHNKQLDAGVYFVFFKYGNNTKKFKMTIVK
ncbi:MAG TPA: T9SS type A sorting domain-containing protein, partial [Firmicutes bacterium]|nr:T9SS type A sorting domain-containing protein [Bacillota bacterium]